MQAILPFLGGAVGLIGNQLLKGPGKPPAALPTVQRDTAAATIAADDELRRRRGSAADILTGAAGAEPVLTGGKLVLG